MAFIMLRYIPSMPAFWRVFFFFFTINGCWILSKTFSTSIEITTFIFQFVPVVYHINWFVNIEESLHNPCIPGINPFTHWSWCVMFLICCWIPFAGILLRIFAYVHQRYWAVVFFFMWHLCLVLVSAWWCPHRMSLGNYLPLQFSGRIWVR